LNRVNLLSFQDTLRLQTSGFVTNSYIEGDAQVTFEVPRVAGDTFSNLNDSRSPGIEDQSGNELASCSAPLASTPLGATL
jgi:hypothetical protein